MGERKMLIETITLLGTLYLAYKDIKERRIPNPMIIILLLTGGILSLRDGYFFVITNLWGIPLPFVILEATLLFILSLSMYVFGVISPGDVKLLTIMPFLLPVEAVGVFVLSIGQSMIASVFVMVREKSWSTKEGLPFTPFVFISICVMLFLRLII